MRAIDTTMAGAAAFGAYEGTSGAFPETVPGAIASIAISFISAVVAPLVKDFVLDYLKLKLKERKQRKGHKTKE